MNERDIRAIISNNKYSDLGLHGFGVSFKRDETPEQRRKKLQENQSELLQSAKICTRICEWLKQVDKTKTIRHGASSYRWKHIVEADLGDYCSNGQFICAAIHMGFKCVRRDPNAVFNMSADVVSTAAVHSINKVQFGRECYLFKLSGKVFETSTDDFPAHMGIVVAKSLSNAKWYCKWLATRHHNVDRYRIGTKPDDFKQHAATAFCRGADSIIWLDGHEHGKPKYVADVVYQKKTFASYFTIAPKSFRTLTGEPFIYDGKFCMLLARDRKIARDMARATGWKVVELTMRKAVVLALNKLQERISHVAFRWLSEDGKLNTDVISVTRLMSSWTDPYIHCDI